MFDRLPKVLGSVIEATLAPHPVDRYLELVDPMITWSDLRARIVDIERRTPRTITLILTPTRQWTGFTAGQYVQLSVVIDGVRQTRCFSPANAEGGRGGRIELTITSHDGGLVSRHLRENARVGDVLGLTPAVGDFCMPTPRPARMLFVSGGSGVTPVLSMLRTLVAERHRGAVDFVHYAATPNDVVYAAEVDDIARAHPEWNIRTVYTRRDGEIGHPRGHFVPAHLDELAPDHRSAEVFVCGPAGLMAAVTDYFTDLGRAEAVHSEAFTAPATFAPDPDQPVSGELTFTGARTTAANDGRTILEQAESAGLTPEFGCRMGICFSCTAPKKSGCTRNVLTGELDTDSDTHIQICVSAPVGDVEIDL
ncbi:ferredoxin reductase [Williamsia sp. CHRR-6]|uniref:ferredoxin reductase n=1 Tax=Williamsia sp. CHRR-6 TaxID=2835871 RepID=UPI001BD949CA|nr:ferredoxin reductase [Williamsia sp. CHRR-6]MBT0566693.1 ferredoxin reductase [Williamsia sp. CHRR-6]